MFNEVRVLGLQKQIDDLTMQLADAKIGDGIDSEALKRISLNGTDTATQVDTSFATNLPVTLTKSSYNDDRFNAGANQNKDNNIIALSANASQATSLVAVGETTLIGIGDNGLLYTPLKIDGHCIHTQQRLPIMPRLTTSRGKWHLAPIPLNVKDTATDVSIALLRALPTANQDIVIKI